MKLHATLRRTLAMLLVLIFALSNMGLAEVAEQLTQYEEVSEVLEEYVETEAVETAEEPEADAEPEGDAESQAPEEIPIEEEAPAPELGAEAYLLDPDSIFADATVANYDGELSYAWERAGEDGKWTAIDGANEAIYVNTEADREAYAYRCVVRAGDVAATTNAVEFGTVEFVPDASEAAAPEAAEPALIMADTDFGLAQLNAEKVSEITVSSTDNAEASVGANEFAIIYPSAVSTGTTAITLKATASGPNRAKYLWKVTKDESSAFQVLESSSKSEKTNTDYDETDSVTLQWGSSEASTYFSGGEYSKDVTVKVYAIDATEEGTVESKGEKEVTIHILKPLTSADAGAFKLKTTKDVIKAGESSVTVQFGDPANQLESAKYTAKFAVKDQSGSDVAEDAVKINVGPNGVGTITTDADKLKSIITDEASTEFKIVGTVEGIDEGTFQVEKTINIRPAIESVKIAADAEKASMLDNDVTGVALTATVDPAYAYVEGVKWSVEPSGTTDYSDSTAITNASPNTLTVKPTASKGTLDGQEVTVSVSGADGASSITPYKFKLFKSSVDAGSELTEAYIKVASSTVAQGSDVEIISTLDKIYDVQYSVKADSVNYIKESSTPTSTGVKFSTYAEGEGGKDNTITDKHPVTITAKLGALEEVSKDLTFNIVPKVNGLTINSTSGKNVLSGLNDTITLTGEIQGGGSMASPSGIKWSIAGNNQPGTNPAVPYVLFDSGSSTGNEMTGKTATVKVVKALDEAPAEKIVVTATYESAGGEPVSADFEISYLNMLSQSDLTAAGIAGLEESYVQPKTGTIDITLSLGEGAEAYNSATTWAIKVADKQDDKAHGTRQADTTNHFKTEKLKDDGKLKINAFDETNKFDKDTVFTVTATVTQKDGTGANKEITVSKDFTLKPSFDTWKVQRVTKGANAQTADTFSVIPQEGGKSVLTVPLNETVILGARFMIDANPYGNGTVTWTVKKGEKLEVLTPDTTKNPGYLTVPTNEVTTYQIAARAEGDTSAAKSITVRVQQPIDTVKLSADRSYIIVDETTTDTVTLTADVGDEETVYTGDLTWNIEYSLVGEKVDDEVVGFEGGAASFKGKTEATISTKEVASDGGSIVVSVTSASAAHQAQSVTIKVLKTPTLTEEEKKDAVAVSKDKIAQGEGNISVNLSDAVKTASSLGAFASDYLSGVTYEISTSANGISGEAAIAKYVALVEGQKGVFSILPLSTETATANKITSDMEDKTADKSGVKFTVTAKFAGVKAANATIGTADFWVYPIPDKVDAVFVTDTETAADKIDDPNTETSAVTPGKQDNVLFKGAKVLLRAKAATNDGATPLGDLPAWTVEQKNDSGATASGIVSVTTGKTEAGSQTVLIEALQSGSATVSIKPTSATPDDDPSVVTLTFVVSNENIQPDPTKIGAGGVLDHDHIWAINQRSNVKAADGTYGHTYMCQPTEKTCAMISLPVPHRFETTVDEDGNVTAVCAVCGFSCQHKGTLTADEKKGLDGKYMPTADRSKHTYVCPICGETITEKHDDTGTPNTFCDYCGATMAKAELTYKKTTLTVGAAADIPADAKLVVTGANAFTESYSVASGDEAYITVDPIDGTITDVKPLPASKDSVKIIATIHIDGGVDQSGKPLTDEITATVDIKIVEAVAAEDITISGDDWVTPDIGTKEADIRYYAYTATVDGDNPALDGFKWEITDKTGDGDNKVSLFVDNPEYDPDAEPLKPQYIAYEPDGEDANALKVYVGVAQDAVLTAGGSGTDIKFKLSYGKDDVTATKEIEFLPKLTDGVLNAQMQLKLTAGTNIAQGQQSDVVIDLDPRYVEAFGDVTLEFTSNRAGGALTRQQIPEWVEGGTKDGKPVIQAKPANNSTNLFESGSSAESFTVHAVVKGPVNPDATDETDAQKYPKKVNDNTGVQFNVVPAPAGIKIQMKDDTGAWVDATAQTMTKEKDNIVIKAVPVDAAGKELTGNISIKWANWNFDEIQPKAEEDETVPEILVIKDENGSAAVTDETDTGAYQITVGKDAPASITLTATSGNFTQSVTITVKSQITKMTVTPSIAEIAAGEKHLVNGLSETIKTITIDAAVVEPSDYDTSDEFEWVATYLSDSEISDTSYTGEGNGDNVPLTGRGNAQRTLNVPPTAAQKQVIRVTVKPTYLATGATGNYCDIVIYKPADASALALTLADGAESPYTFKTGESIQIEKAGYADGYGATTKPGKPEVVNSAPDEGFEGKPVIEVVEDPDATAGMSGWKVVAKNPGTADVEIYAYDYNAARSENLTHKATLQFKVEKSPDHVEFKDTVELTKEIGEGDTFEILEKNLTATNDPDAETSVAPGVGTVNYKLVADPEGVVEIEPSTTLGSGSDTGWVVKGTAVGDTTIYAKVGDTTSTKGIQVSVEAIGNEVFFTDGTARLDAQKTLKIGQKLTLTAKTDVAKSFGGITWDVMPTNQSVVKFGEVTDDALELEAVGAGTATFTISITNKKHTATEDTKVDPARLKATIEIKVMENGEDAPGYSAEVAFAGKQAIGIGETTTAVVVGLEPEAGKAFAWESADEDIATVNESTGVVTGVKSGATKITAKYDGAEVGSVTVHVLTEVTDWGVKNITITKGEIFAIEPDYKGYEFDATDTDHAGIEIDDKGLWAITFVNEAKGSKLVTLASDDGDYTVTGLATGKAEMSFKPYGSAAAIPFTVEVTKSALKGFTLSLANSTLYLKPQGSEKLTVTYNPTTAPANLTWTVAKEGEPSDDIVITGATGDPTTYTVQATDAADSGSEYDVFASAEGVQGIASQHFAVVIADDAASATDAKIMLRKVGTDETFEVANGATVDVVKGEKLLAMLYESDSPLGGVAWTSDNVKKASVAGNMITAISGSAKISATAGSAYSFTVKAAKVPAVKLEPNATSITVGVGEKFQMGLKDTYNYSGEWYSVTGGEAIGLENTETDDVINKTEWIASVVGVATVTLTPTWGKSAKTVNITVKDPANLSFDADELTLTKGDKLRVKANLGDGYANLQWFAGENAETEIKKTTTKLDGTKLTAKLIANDEVELTAKTNTALASVKLTAKAPGCDQSDEVTINIVDRSGLAIPADATVTFAKDVIGAKESTQAIVLDENGQNIASSLTWKSDATKIATVNASTGVVTGKKNGVANIIATRKDTKAEVARGTIYVLTEGKLQFNVWPKTMAKGELATIEILINGYADDAHVLPQDGSKVIDTTDLITATSSSDLITVDSIYGVSETEGEDDDTSTHHYYLVLQAKEDAEKVNNKYPKATVAVNLSWKKNVKKGSIQVIEQPNFTDDGGLDVLEVYFPTEINIAKGKSIALTPSFGNVKNVAANFNWTLKPIELTDDLEITETDVATSEQLLKDKALYVKDGKLYANSKTAVPGMVWLDGMAMIEDAIKSVHTLVTVCDAVKSNKDFEIVAPKMSAGLSEKVQLDVRFTGGRKAGTVAWTSSNTKVATIDKSSGLVTTKKAGTVTFTLKVNGKANKLKNFKVLADIPTGISFADAEQNSQPGGTVNFKVNVAGYTGDYATAAAAKSVYSVEIVDGEDCVDEENSDLYAGKLKIKSDVSATGKIRLRATTYNGMIGECLISLGATTAGDVQAGEAATVELRMNGNPLTENEVVNILEQQSVTLEAVVKDANGIALRNPNITWSTDEHYKIEGTGTKVTLTATKYSFDETTYNELKPAVSATVSGTSVTSSFNLIIGAVLSADHMRLKIEPTTLITGQTATLTFDVDGRVASQLTRLNPVLNFQTKYYTDSGLTDTTEKTEIEKVLTITDSENPNRSFKITAKAPGTAVIKGYIEVDEEKIVLEEKTIEVINNPTPDDLAFNGLTTANSLTLAEGESVDFTAKFTGEYAGKETDDTFAEPVVEKPDPSEESGYKAISDDEINVTADGDTIGAYKLVANTKGTYRVTFKAFDTTGASTTYAVTKSFDVTVTAAPELEVTVAAPLTLTVGTIQATEADKTVTLNATRTGTEKPVTWKIKSVGGTAYDTFVTTNEGKEDVPVPTLSADKGDTTTLSYTGDSTIVIQALIDTFSATDTGKTWIKEITIQYAKLPTDKSGVTAELKDGEKRTPVSQIAVGEVVTATIAFNTPATTYSNDIVWTQEPANDYVKFEPSDSGRTCKITGLKKTGSTTGMDSDVKIFAKANGVELYSTTLHVLDRTTTLDIAHSDGKKLSADLKLNTSSDTTLKAVLDEGTDALVKLQIVPNVAGESIEVEADTANKNEWKITYTVSSSTSATVTFWIEDAGGKLLRKSYNVSLES